MPAGIDTPLDVVELRVLGSLVEKESTTPDSYPLTLNALVAACNQTSNREPVLALDQAAVAAAVAGLTRRALASEVHRSDSRARRYRHLLSETFKLHPAEIAVLGVLLLRGPQTVGELRSRTARMFEFLDLKHVEITLGALLTLPQPLVALLPRRPGQKEQRYAQLLGCEPPAEPDVAEAAGVVEGSAPVGAGVQPDRVSALEQVVDTLRAELAELRDRFEEFRREFQ
jgi:hypothetical protein